MSNITITRTTFTDDDGSGTTGTLWNAAQITSIYDQIDALATKFQNDICDGRLTLTSGSPVTTGDVTGATNIYWSPYKGNRISLYDGSAAWATITFTETTQALGTLVNGQAYDVFAFNTSGTIGLEVVEWKNATVTVTIATPAVVTWTAHGLSTGQTFVFTTSAAGLPTGVAANTVYFVTVVDANSFKLSTTQTNLVAGTFIATSGTQSGTHTGHMPYARQTALVLQDGVLVKSGTTTRRYLGTFVTTATTTTEDSFAKRFVWNYYNRGTRGMRGATEGTDSWSYSLTTYRQANANAANQLAFVVGVAEVLVKSRVLANASNATVPQNIAVAVGVDNITAQATGTIGSLAQCAVAGDGVYAEAVYEAYSAIGYHAWAWLEKSITGTGTTNWTGDGGLAGSLQTGIYGSLEG